MTAHSLCNSVYFRIFVDALFMVVTCFPSYQDRRHVVLEKHWRDTGFILKTSRGSVIIPLPFNGTWTTLRYPLDKSLSSGCDGEANCVIHWIVIYPVDSAIQLLNNWALVDKAYPDGGPLLTPIRANQMALLNNRERSRAHKFNRLLSKSRVKVEHVFKEMKTYKAVGEIWCYPRWLMPICVESVTF